MHKTGQAIYLPKLQSLNERDVFWIHKPKQNLMKSVGSIGRSDVTKQFQVFKLLNDLDKVSSTYSP